MKELINVKRENGKSLVSARELHKGLEIGSKYIDWFSRMCEYGFDENIDFSVLKSGNPNGGIDKIDDIIITLDMAKHIAMIQRSELGKKFREYFIECEKQLMQIKTDSYMIEDPIERASRWIEKQKEKQQLLEFIKE